MLDHLDHLALQSSRTAAATGRGAAGRSSTAERWTSVRLVHRPAVDAVDAVDAGRRRLLRTGLMTVGGLALASLLRGQQAALGASAARAKSCILLWLDGGPSHLETFDMKPDAPAEVRGPFQAIGTNVPGIELCEHLPRTSRIADKLAIVRSLTSPLGEHGLANHYVLTGYKPSPVLSYPSYGSVVARLRGGRPVLPPYVVVPEARNSTGAGFLGTSYEPFVVGGDPSRSDFRVRDLDNYPDVTDARLQRRREFLRGLDERAPRGAADDDDDNTADSGTADSPPEQAFRLITSRDAKRAFELRDEPADVRERYGPRTIGQSCLLARRLIEQGVPFVTVVNSGWDTHEGLVLQLRDGYSGAKTGVGLIPSFDLAFAALISDLEERGLLDETLVMAMGEFGRTPKLNTRGGRDHWPRVFSMVLAGAGIRGGQVIGSSDRVGESPRDNPITPADLACTIYHLLGIDSRHLLYTSDGRPVAVNQGGRLIRELT